MPAPREQSTKTAGPGATIHGGYRSPADQRYDRFTAAAILLIPALLVVAGGVVWPAPTIAECFGQTPAQADWMHTFGAMTGVCALAAALLLCGVYWRHGKPQMIGLLAGSGLLLGFIAALSSVSLMFVLAIPGAFAAIWVLSAGLTVLASKTPHTALLGSALWAEIFLVLPAVFAVLALTAGASPYRDCS